MFTASGDIQQKNPENDKKIMKNTVFLHFFGLKTKKFKIISDKSEMFSKFLVFNPKNAKNCIFHDFFVVFWVFLLNISGCSTHFAILKTALESSHKML